MTEESKKDDKPEGTGNKPNEGGKDKPGDKPGAAAAKPAASKPGDAGGAPPKPGPATAAAKEPEKKTGPSVPASGAAAKPGSSTPPPGAGVKPGEGKRPPAAPPKKAKKSGCFTTVLWLVAVLVAIVVVGYYTWPRWSHFAEPYLPKVMTTPSANVQAMEKTIKTLERRIGAVEQRTKGAGDLEAAIAALEKEGADARKQLDAVSARIATLESTLESLAKMTKAAEAGESAAADAGAASQAALQQLSVRIAQLDGKVTQSAESAAQSAAEIAERVGALEAKAQAVDEATAGAAAAALAVGQLAQALDGSGPFAAELNAVKSFAKDDAEMAAAIAALEPRAAGGVPTVSELRARFPAVAEAVSRADTKLEGEGWVENALNRLSSLVSVRRKGDTAVAAGGADAALAGAERALAAGDLAAAVQALETLGPSGAAAAAGWLGDAHARMTAERLLATLQARAISLLAARG